jgi:hypothetical protein
VFDGLARCSRVGTVSALFGQLTTSAGCVTGRPYRDNLRCIGLSSDNCQILQRCCSKQYSPSCPIIRKVACRFLRCGDTGGSKARVAVGARSQSSKARGQFGHSRFQLRHPKGARCVPRSPFRPSDNRVVLDSCTIEGRFSVKCGVCSAEAADWASLPLLTAQNLVERLEDARHLWQNRGTKGIEIAISSPSRKARSRRESLVSRLE